MASGGGAVIPVPSNPADLGNLQVLWRVLASIIRRIGGAGQYATPGWNSVSVEVGDDTAVSFTPPNPAGAILLHDAASQFAQAIFNTATPAMTAMFTVSGNVVLTTGILAGTTGTNGKLTISAASDGRIYIENRLGAVRTIAYSVLNQ